VPTDNSDRAARLDVRGPRVWRIAERGGWYPVSWSTTSSVDRLSECVAWDRYTLRAKHHLDFGVQTLESSTSFSSTVHLGCLALLQELRSQDPDAWVEALRLLGIEYVLAPRSLIMPAEIHESPFIDRHPWDEVGCWQVSSPFPPAWIVPKAHWQATRDHAAPRTVTEWKEHLRAAWFPPHRIDWRTTVRLEGSPDMIDQRLPTSDLPDARSADDIECRIVERTAQGYVVEARLAKPGWLVVNASYLPGWHAVVDTGHRRWREKVWRANETMLAIRLPAGRQRVELTYFPASVTWGLGLSGLTWTLFLSLVAIARRRQRNVSIGAGASYEPA
jgi:hypothetical protein